LRRAKPKLIAIVGGSGAGKTWLAGKLKQMIGKNATRLSLDDFYRDRSHLTSKRRNAINFDHPRAIDWKHLERVLKKISSGRPVRAPRYDFATHTRIPQRDFVKPKPLVIMDGLWLLRRPTLRKLFSFRIFVDCPQRLRLLRRLNRDLAERGRNPADIRKQFVQQVTPMHDRFVLPQALCANVVVANPSENDVHNLAKKIKTLLPLN
jgi:uridine kinase